MKTAYEILNDNHWNLEAYSQRMTIAEWKQILSEEADHPIVKGRPRRLVAKPLGYGFVDVSKEPLTGTPRVLTGEDIERIGKKATENGSAINRNPQRS